MEEHAAVFSRAGVSEQFGVPGELGVAGLVPRMLADRPGDHGVTGAVHAEMNCLENPAVGKLAAEFTFVSPVDQCAKRRSGRGCEQADRCGVRFALVR